VKIFRIHRRWALLPAIIWLALQFAMTAGASARAGIPAAGGSDFDALSPLVGGLAPSLWLCGPASNTPPDGGEPAPDFVKGCYWCQAFGAMPELAKQPDALPASKVSALLNQPFADPGEAVSLIQTTGFQSRAPPL
jgi:hypothetical protein